MQILAGKYRNRHLQSSASPKVRPTARRIRELLFEYLGSRIEGARVLDLCAGSGAVGIEALSRGAAHATFVDRSPKFCSFIEANLALCGVPEAGAKVITSEAVPFLRRALKAGDRVWEIAFFDPPYEADYEPVLTLFGQGSLLKRRGGVLIAEHHYEKQIPDLIGTLRRERTIIQGESGLSFYEKAGELSSN